MTPHVTATEFGTPYAPLRCSRMRVGKRVGIPIAADIHWAAGHSERTAEKCDDLPSGF